ncbi:hypothetical protein [Desulfospira joergensenii]|uniref:hypothetical protein n=1 Tax=Desulfospira joergensenii TaxID=53329 RepID=UPI0003B30989|nr:hypothetical protein [Desulfospira joergensenii]
MEKAKLKADKWNKTFWPGVPILIKKSEKEGVVKTTTLTQAYTLESSDLEFYPYIDCEGFGQCDLDRVEVDHTLDCSPWLKSQNPNGPKGSDRVFDKWFMFTIGIILALFSVVLGFAAFFFPGHEFDGKDIPPVIASGGAAIFIIYSELNRKNNRPGGSAQDETK